MFSLRSTDLHDTLVDSHLMLQAVMTQCKMEVRILSGGVTKNLTLHGMSKIDFQPDFRNPHMLSFPIMYNSMGSKVDGLAVRELLSDWQPFEIFFGVAMENCKKRRL